VKAVNVEHPEERLAPIMLGTNVKRPLSADHLLTAAAFLVIAYVGLYYASVHRPTLVACQYYAYDWNGRRYFLADSLFYPVDWLDRTIGVSEWQRLRRIGIAHQAYHDMCRTLSAGGGKR
jgi:hypothetical protein